MKTIEELVPGDVIYNIINPSIRTYRILGIIPPSDPGDLGDLWRYSLLNEETGHTTVLDLRGRDRQGVSVGNHTWCSEVTEVDSYLTKYYEDRIARFYQKIDKSMKEIESLQTNFKEAKNNVERL